MARPQLSKPDAARRRFIVVHLALCMAFAVAMLGTVEALKRLEDPAARWLVTAVPIGVLMAWAWAFAGFVRTSDEMIQQLQLRAVAISGAAIILLMTAWGTLERLMPVPEFPLFLAGPAFAVVYGLVLPWLNARP